MSPHEDDVVASESAALDASGPSVAPKNPTPMFRYTPPPFFDAHSRVPRVLQLALADVFMFVIYHYNLWAVPVLAFFYALYQVSVLHRYVGSCEGEISVADVRVCVYGGVCGW